GPEPELDRRNLLGLNCRSGCPAKRFLDRWRHRSEFAYPSSRRGHGFGRPRHRPSAACGGSFLSTGSTESRSTDRGGMSEMIDLNREERIAKLADQLEQEWTTSPRWRGVERNYSAEQVVRLRGSFQVDHTIARLGAERLWDLLRSEDYVAALGAITGNQAVEMVKAGLKAIYLSGWQVAADNNESGQTYPDQSLYPANSVPSVVRRINNARRRAD